MRMLARRLTPSRARSRRRLLLLAALPAAFLLWSAPALASISLTSPMASTTYVNNVTASYSIDETPGAVQLVFTYTSGSSATAGNVWTVNLSSTGTSGAVSIPIANPTSAAGGAVSSVTPSAGATGTSLPDGTYSVVARYQTAAAPGVDVVSTTRTGVELDATTLTPTLTSPAALNTSNAIGVSYSLPEAGLTGTGKLTFASAGATRVLSLVDGDLTAGAHSFTIDPANLSSSAHVSSVAGGTALPDGTYDVTFQYGDTAAHAAASAVSASWTLDTVTQAPVLVSPVAGRDTQRPTVTYTLPETGLSGSATLTLTDGTSTWRFGVADAAGTHDVALARSDLAASTGASQLAGTSVLPDGTYAATVTYRDALGNPSASVTATGIVLSTPAAQPDPGPTSGATAPTPAAASPTPSAVPTSGPLAPLTIGSFEATWRLRTATRATPTLRATFKPQPRAVRYRIVATHGSTKYGTCARHGKGAKATVTCVVRVGRPGTWRVRVNAIGTSRATIARTPIRTVRVRAA